MKCPECKKEFKNYNGLATHLARSHKIYKEDAYVLVFKAGKKPICDYKDCQNIPKFRGASRGYQRFCTSHRGKWQEGLTSATDDRVKSRGKKISEAQLLGKHWSSNKETKDLVADKIGYARSLTKKAKVKKYPGLSKGYGWSKGLDKSDPRVRAIGDSVKSSIEKNGSWNKGLTKESDWRIAKLAKSKLLSRNEVLERLAQNKDFNLEQKVSEYQGYQTHMNFTCKTCGTFQRKTLKSIDEKSRCYVCFPYGFTSKIEEEVREYIKSLGQNCFSTRQEISPFEIDAFVPALKLGIEVNGLYWHSEKAGKDKKAHQIKTELCKEKEISLFHIFEDEWINKPDIVKSIITHKLGLSKFRISARECSIIFNHGDANEFIAGSHLDGNVRSSQTISLVFNDEIVGCLSMRKPLHANHGTLELARLCFRTNTSVAGGSTRLLKYMKDFAKSSGYKRIMTYADQRLGHNNHYQKSGFQFVGETPIRFWWTDFSQRYNRFQFRAKDGKSQKEVAEKAGVTRIWGCKNSKYMLQL